MTPLFTFNANSAQRGTLDMHARSKQARRLRAALCTTVSIGSVFLASSAYAQDAQPTALTHVLRYDARGLLVGEIAPDPDGGGPLGFAATRTTYDAVGLPVKVETGELSAWQPTSVAPAAWPSFTVLQTQHFEYDTMNRQVRTWVVGSNGAVASMSQSNYDRSGRPGCAATRMNPTAYNSLPANACSQSAQGSFGPDRISRSVYDLAGQLTRVEEGVGTPLLRAQASYTYSLNGKQASLTDARGYTAGMYYDGHDRLVGWALPSKTTPGQVSATDFENYAYDANGNRTSMRKRDGSVLNFQYDALNRMTAKIVPERADLSPTHTRDVYYGYDLRGLQAYARFDGSGGEGVANSWDGFGRQVSSTLVMDGQTRPLNFSYNANGKRIRMTYPDGTSYITYGYDGLGRQVAMYENGVSQLTAVSYNQRGTPSGFSRRMGDHTIAAYDPVGRLSSYTHNFVAGTGNVTTSLGYTPSSQIAQQSLSNASYAWDAHVSRDLSYSINGLNQYVGVGPNPYSYDANGNLTSDALTSYQYDVENRLVGVGGQSTAQLRYDPLGRLYETTDYKPGGTGLTRFLYDSDELVVEYGSVGQVLKQYVHGTGTDDPLIWYEGSSFGVAAARYLYTNHQGSIVAVAGSNGASLAINSYDEYGIPSSGNKGRFQYTGQSWMSETGLYYYKARFYSPLIGRFLQTDPIGYEGGYNLYSYTSNNPVNAADPTGLQTYFWGGAGNSDTAAYKSDMVLALAEAGIVNVQAVPETSTSPQGLPADLATLPIVNNLQSFSVTTNSVAPAAGSGGQYNLMGYSYGAVLASQQALADANNGIVVDNLILIGPPINQDLYDAVRSNQNIRSVITQTLNGDPIYPGISDAELGFYSPVLALQMAAGTGHFYYAGADQTGRERRRTLGNQLYGLGVR